MGGGREVQPPVLVQGSPIYSGLPDLPGLTRGKILRLLGVAALSAPNPSLPSGLPAPFSDPPRHTKTCPSRGLDYISRRAWQSGGLCTPSVPVASDDAAGYERGGPFGLSPAGPPLGPRSLSQLRSGGIKGVGGLLPILEGGGGWQPGSRALVALSPAAHRTSSAGLRFMTSTWPMAGKWWNLLVGVCLYSTGKVTLNRTFIHGGTARSLMSPTCCRPRYLVVTG